MKTLWLVLGIVLLSPQLSQAIPIPLGKASLKFTEEMKNLRIFEPAQGKIEMSFAGTKYRVPPQDSSLGFLYGVHKAQIGKDSIHSEIEVYFGDSPLLKSAKSNPSLFAQTAFINNPTRFNCNSDDNALIVLVDKNRPYSTETVEGKLRPHTIATCGRIQ